MDVLIGTPQCPHLGFGARDGLPCCHADESTRLACGRWAPNPQTVGRSGTESNLAGLDPFFCTVLGKESLPPEALRLAARQKAEAARQAHPAPPRYRPPAAGGSPPRTAAEREADPDQPVIPTHTLRGEERKVAPNAPCPCGSGKKFKKCCGRSG